MNRIDTPKMNHKTGKMEQIIITNSGRKGKIAYATCPYNNCEFHSKEFGSKSREIIINHIEEIHENN